MFVRYAEITPCRKLLLLTFRQNLKWINQSTTITITMIISSLRLWSNISGIRFCLFVGLTITVFCSGSERVTPSSLFLKSYPLPLFLVSTWLKFNLGSLMWVLNFIMYLKIRNSWLSGSLSLSDHCYSCESRI